LFHRAARIATLVWLGAGLMLSFLVGPAIFSEGVTAAIGRRAAGAVAQAVLHRYFLTQIGFAAFVCVAAFVADASTFKRPRVARIMTGTLLAMALIASLWFEPMVKGLADLKYSETATPAAREHATHAFGLWHGISQAANLLTILLLAAHAAHGRASTDGPRAISPSLRRL
jgi:Domain of unknown function (DUF4149)